MAPRRVPTVDVDLHLWGTRIREWRLFRDMTQDQLAEAVGVLVDQSIGHDAVSAWENGRRRPTDPQRVAIAAALRCSPLYLFPYPEVAP